VSTLHYDVHGARVAIASQDEAVGAALHRRLRQFAVDADGPADATFEVGASAACERPSGRSRPVLELATGEASYFDELDVLYLALDDVRWRCDLGAGLAHGSVDARRPESVWRATRLFLVALLELLKRRGLCGLHAASLAQAGRGLLLAGASGSGKSTLALVIARAGFDLFGDDTVFLRSERGAVRALAFPDEVDVADETVELLPWLRHLRGTPKQPGATKRQLRVEDVAPAAGGGSCVPAVIVFPQVADVTSSTLHPITGDEALLELVPNVLLTDPAASQAHLDVLGALAAQCLCYRLATGRDLERLPALLGELLA
jgi:hypothetical protein